MHIIPVIAIRRFKFFLGVLVQDSLLVLFQPSLSTGKKWSDQACYESQPGSWLVAICERSENRGYGGGSCQTGQKSGK